MEIKIMTAEELEARKLAIKEEVNAEGADLAALEAEVRSINEELETRATKAKEEKELRDNIAKGLETTKTIEERGNKPMENIEIRNSAAYIDAYAEYIKSGKDTECRKLLTENGTNGTIPVPTFVDDVVRVAWNKSGVMARVKKAFVAGNLKVGFEISGSEAAVHAEGGDAVAEETLVEGVVNLIPESIKKWVSVSDEVYDLRGEAFLRYIYEELAYRIACKAAKELLTKIQACGTQSTTTQVSVASITSTTVSVGLVAQAIGKLCDSASDPCVIINKATWAKFKEAQYANGYNVDPFEGLPVVFDSSIATFDAATTGVAYAIVGDLAAGALANFPKGEGIEFKFDNMTDMTKDLIRILGREYIAVAPVGPDCFCKICK